MSIRMGPSVWLRVLGSGTLLAPSLCAAGDFTDISSGSGLNGNSLHSMVFADFNNDGYLDMAKGNTATSGVRTICINDGDDTFTVSTTALPVGYRGLGWGDYDNDGDVDLVGRDTSLSPDVNRNDGAADGLSWTEFTQTANSVQDMAKGNTATSGVRTICINDGDDTFTVSTTALPVGYRGLGWGDYDNDGDVDLVGRDTSLSPDVNRNDGAADGLSWTEFTQTANNNEAVMFVDIDGDGDLDLWNMGDAYVWHRNDGGLTFAGQTNMPGVTGEDLPNGEGGTAADINNDGYIDFMWNDSNETNTSTQAWINDGDFTYTNHELVNTDFGLPETVGNHENMEWAWGDYDNDGDLDVFVSGTHGVGLYRNNGSGKPEVGVYADRKQQRSGHVRGH